MKTVLLQEDGPADVETGQEKFAKQDQGRSPRKSTPRSDDVGDDDDDDDVNTRAEKKVGPLEFILHNHSVLSLYFSARGEGAPVMLPCCCVDVSGLERRHRFYVLFFSVIGAFLCQVSTGSVFVSVLLSIFLLLPATCMFKAIVSRFSADINGGLPKPMMKVGITSEVVFLFALFLFTLYVLYTRVGNTIAVRSTLITFVYTWVGACFAEVFTLIYKYACCRVLLLLSSL